MPTSQLSAAIQQARQAHRGRKCGCIDGFFSVSPGERYIVCPMCHGFGVREPTLDQHIGEQHSYTNGTSFSDQTVREALRSRIINPTWGN